MKTIYDITEDLMARYDTLTQFEALSVAVQIQKNHLYAKAHVVPPDNKGQSALEKIAVELDKMVEAIENR